MNCKIVFIWVFSADIIFAFSNDVTCGNFGSKSDEQDELFTIINIKYITFLLRLTQIVHIPKIILESLTLLRQW